MLLAKTLQLWAEHNERGAVSAKVLEVSTACIMQVSTRSILRTRCRLAAATRRLSRRRIPRMST